MSHRVTLIPGDWIGPETCTIVREVIAAAGVWIEWETHDVQDGQLSPALLESCRRTSVALKARLASAPRQGQLPPTIALRKELGLWATVRAVKPLPGIPARFPNLDLVVIRETSEDIYSGFEHEVTSGVYEAVKVTTRTACERIARYAYEYARENGRKKVTIVHKSNIMKKADGLFLRVAQEIGASYPDIVTDEVIVDALCMKLVRNPGAFDVLLAGNLFGDIVSDLASGLGGGLLACQSASFGGAMALFENPHGRAPELVGTGRANPIPMLLAATPMLRYLGEDAAALRVEQAISRAYQDGLRTPEMGGTDGSAAARDAIIRRL